MRRRTGHKQDICRNENGNRERTDKMEIRELLAVNRQFVIGMVHCLPLPGTTGYRGSVEEIYRQAVQDARTLEESGVDAVIVENMGDDPFGVTLDLIQRTTLAVAAQKVRDAVHIPVGVDAAFCDWEASLSIAYSTGCQFVRIPVFVDTVEFYGGLITPCAKECMRYRHLMGMDSVMVLADIQVKHTNMLLPHVSIEQSAKNAAACGAVPVIAGSGVNAANIGEQLKIADGAIIGSSLKEGGIVSNPISGRLVKEVLAELNR